MKTVIKTKTRPNFEIFKITKKHQSALKGGNANEFKNTDSKNDKTEDED